jgi:hypothetical protein
MLLVHSHKHALAPFKHQILVKAMSTHHADELCKQINAIVGDDDFAHTVHIRKPDAENDRLLCRFRGVKRTADGQEVPIPDDERFPCLVQVDMAGEGYNNPYISTLVKADLTRGAPYIMQLIGRALRINYSLDVRPQTVDILIPDDDHATMDLIESEFAIEIAPAPGLGKMDRQEERDIVVLDIPDVLVLEAGFIKLYELNGSAGTAEDDDVVTWADNHMPGWRNFLTLPQLRAAYMAANGMGSQKKEDEKMSEASKREKWRQASEQAVSTLAGNVVRLMTNQPLHHNGSQVAGKVKAAIHGQWIKLGGTQSKMATSVVFERNHAGVKEVNDRVKQRDIPLWLREAYGSR